MTRPVRVLAAAVVLLLLGDAVALAAHDDGTDTSDQASPRQAEAMERVVPEIERFVEQERGLQFERRVKVELLSDKAFVRRLRGDGKADSDSAATAEDFLRALHLIDRKQPLGPAVDKLLGAAVAGFYDPRSKALVVRGGEPTPSVRAVLAHELTHALQDQHFGLRRKALEGRSDEAAQSFTALVEGDAVRIQRRYFQSLSPEDQRRVVDEENAVSRPAGIPDVLVDLLVFPYQVGPSFVGAVVRAGGQPRLDAAFATPPTTSEQLLHPDVYLAGQAAQTVTTPKADGPVFDRGVMGELGLLLLLGNGAADDNAARAAAAGWGGDRYVAWRRGGKACVRARIVMDTLRDRDELDAALRRWARRTPGATVTSAGDGPLTLTSCG